MKEGGGEGGEGIRARRDEGVEKTIKEKSSAYTASPRYDGPRSERSTAQIGQAWPEGEEQTAREGSQA